MIVNNSYLVLAGIFLLYGIFFYQNNNFITTLIVIWSALVFSFFWLVHFLKVKHSKDYAPLLVRDSILKQCLLGFVFLPFYVFRYLSLLEMPPF